MLAGLAASGYEDGRTIRVHRFNAEGDAATSSTIARAIVGGDDERSSACERPAFRRWPRPIGM